MKKLIITICILLLIFLTLFFYTKTNQQKQELTIEEIEKIEKYISTIYMWKEVTKDALPKFNTINEAPEKWIWEVVKKNIDNYDLLTIEEINKKGKEIFGDKLEKEYQKDQKDIFILNQETNSYEPISTELDNLNDTFFINKIEKEKKGYKVEIVEYLEDYTEETMGKEEYEISIKNTKEEEISKVKNTEENQKIIEEVKNNIEKFNKKTIQLEKTSNGIICKNVQ